MNDEPDCPSCNGPGHEHGRVTMVCLRSDCPCMQRRPPKALTTPTTMEE